MTDELKVTLEYIGPPHQDWYDGDKLVTLVPGRRYQVAESLAAYLAEANSTHWKRPEAPKAAKAKE